ncbi:hypothetical protein [Lactiplantibacillus paraxiangfangensis]|uniref:hypothetical protein n=1 Tax=Lactiplantibacillus paraxiangfangensis TaxID=3076224 RepID=UPI0030C683F1
MKLTKVLSIIVAGTTLGVAGGMVSSSVSVQAKTKKSIKTFPKSFRGTYYRYEGKVDGVRYYNIARISAKTFGSRADMGTYTVPFHLHSVKLPVKRYAKKYNKKYKVADIYATKKGSVLYTYPILKITFPMAGYYKMGKKKLAGHKVKVLKRVSKNGKHTDEYLFTSKKLARKYGVH